MKFYASLIEKYIESRRYKGKSLGKYDQGIKELAIKIFKLNEGK